MAVIAETALETSVSPQQVIVNAILALLKGTVGVSKVDWKPIPRLRSRTRVTAGNVVAYISHISADVELQSTGSRFITTAIIGIDLVTPVDDPDSKDRAIHKVEQRIIDTIHKNPQIRPTFQGLPADMSIEQMRVLGMDYGVDQSDESATDEVLIQVGVSYVRVVKK